ncbi:MAG: methyl-accepting chemotaxis protein [Massilia sp.]
MKVSSRLILLVSTALVALAIMGGFALYNLRSSMYADREAQITNLVKMGEHIADYYYQQEKAGTLTREQAQAAARIALGQMVNGLKSYLWVRTPEGLNLVHPNKNNIGKIAQGEAMDGRTDGDAYIEALSKSEVAMVTTKTYREGVLRPKMNGLINFKPWGWWIGTGFFIDTIDEVFWQAAWQFLAVFVVAFAAISVLGWQVVRHVVGSLGGDPAYAGEVTRRIAGKDLSVPVDLRDGDDHSLLLAISRMQQELAGTVRNIRNNASSMATASREIASGNLDLSARTEAQASALEETAASIEELTATVKNNSARAQEASQMAQAASSSATGGGGVVAQVVTTMESIRQASDRIVEITGVIDSIAFQTNILALNAAVEAARAGEQGRGFAVVASEVRNLAQRSASAAKEIKGLIDNSVQEVERGSRLANDAGAAMHDIVSSVAKVSAIVQDISESGREQTAGIEQVNQAIIELDDVTQQNAALVEEAAAAARSMQDQAAELAGLVSQFNLNQADEPVAPKKAVAAPVRPMKRLAQR